MKTLDYGLRSQNSETDSRIAIAAPFSRGRGCDSSVVCIPPWPISVAIVYGPRVAPEVSVMVCCEPNTSFYAEAGFRLVTAMSPLSSAKAA